ncbi:MAG: DsrE family protein, partial [Hyphomicrobiaceae bacterium]
MHGLRKLALVALLAAPFLAAAPAIAADASLFVNATTDEPHRAKMALGFAQKQQERKHAITIFLNDRAVLIGSKKKSGKFKEHQAMLAGMMKAGARVLICPMCMEHYKVKKDDLIDGVEVGNPDLVGG